MSLLDDIRTIEEKIAAFVDGPEVEKFLGFASTVSGLVATIDPDPQAKAIAGMISTISGSLDTALQAHAAAGGSTPANDAALVSHVLNTVVASGAVTGGAATTLTNSASATVNAIPGAPDALAAMSAYVVQG